MISKNISYKESIRSNTATRLGIDNTPNDEQISNMRLVAEMIFQPLRLWTGGPIKVTEGVFTHVAIDENRKPRPVNKS